MRAGPTTEQVERVRDSVIAAAKRAERAGFNGVAVHGAFGWILSEFMSPVLNDRTDSYGGSLENWARLTIEVIEGIRRACGPVVPDAIVNKLDLDSFDALAVSLDLPGHGRSWGRAVQFSDYWRVIDAMLNHAGVVRAILCGLPIGGQAGLALAARRPERTNGPVLVNTVLGLEPDQRARRIAIYDLLLEPGSAARWADALLTARSPTQKLGQRRPTITGTASGAPSPIDGKAMVIGGESTLSFHC